jgi:hypothetical protein
MTMKHQKNPINEFRPELLPTDTSDGPENILGISAKKDVPLLRY